VHRLLQPRHAAKFSRGLLWPSAGHFSADGRYLHPLRKPTVPSPPLRLQASGVTFDPSLLLPYEDMKLRSKYAVGLALVLDASHPALAFVAARLPAHPRVSSGVAGRSGPSRDPRLAALLSPAPVLRTLPRARGLRPALNPPSPTA